MPLKSSLQRRECLLQKIIPIIRMIQHKVAEKTALARNASASSLGAALQKYINKRWSNAESICVLALATFLDPRFKTLGFAQTPPSSDDLWELLDSRVSETHRHYSSNSDATIEDKRYLSDAYLP
ncbi:hypothetical protein QQF64_000243 [Cirrhinus molitorella]|uniref:Uncharacterized protein n=1 Tax=Cirrhinus molitorella TaxID=172907 RepID=A0ABR3NY70_9TELE